MSQLTKYERVMRTVRFEETDRVPFYDNLLNDAVIEYYAEHQLTVANAKRVTGRAINRVLDITGLPYGPFHPKRYTDEQDLTIQLDRWTSWIVERPFDDVSSLKPWLRKQIQELGKQHWTSGHAQTFHQSIHERQRDFAMQAFDGRDDPAVLVPSSRVGLTPLFSAVGLELFSYVLADAPELVDEWLDAWCKAELRRIAMFAKPELFPIVLIFDDIAHKTGPLFSPKWLRAMWLPRLRTLVNAWHSRDTLCLFYSDGNLWKIMDDLVDAGIDGLTPLEAQAGMSIKAIREKYPHLFLAGGIDVSQLLPFGTPDEVRSTCLQTITDAGGRGYFIGSSVELHQEVPLENARAMYECQR